MHLVTQALWWRCTMRLLSFSCLVTTSILQSMDKEVLLMLKLYSLRNTFLKATACKRRRTLAYHPWQYPLGEFVLLVSAVLRPVSLQGLPPKGEILPPEDTPWMLLNQCLTLGHQGILVFRNQQARGEVIVFAGGTDPNHEVKVSLLL